MKLAHIALAGLIAGSVLVAAAPWQDAAKDKAMPFTETEMKAWQESATPGPQHEEFARCTGSWNVKSQCWMAPGAPMQEGTGTAEFKTILGGRYLVEEFSGTTPMGPFKGHGMLGYNNTTAEWEHVWIDDMSTGMMVSKGDAKGDGTTLHGQAICPMNGKPVTMRIVMTKVNDNEHKVEMWSTLQGEPEYRSMALLYTRAGAKTSAVSR